MGWTERESRKDVERFVIWESTGQKEWGILTGEFTNQYGVCYVFQTNNEVIGINGSHQIEAAMENVARGSLVAIQYVDETTTKGGNTVRNFKIKVWEGALPEEWAKLANEARIPPSKREARLDDSPFPPDDGSPFA